MLFARLRSKSDTTDFDEEIQSLKLEMKEMSPESEEYQKYLDALERLHKLKMDQKSERVSPNTLVYVAGSLAGLVVICAFEKSHVISSRAMSLIKFR